MSTRKKPRPLFEVPVEVEDRRESGWVYRSAHEHTPRVRSDESFIDTGATTLALGIAAFAQTLVLGLTIAAIPISLGLPAMQSLTASHR